MLYGAEIYMGLNKEPRSTRTSTDVHLPNVLGVGTLHPKASLFIEMDSLPVVWKPRVRCVQF